MVSIDIVKKLRDETGLSISKCKESLEECNGDLDKAKESLRKKGSVAAQKKADRDLGAGVINSYIHNTYNIGAMVELLCETDFVAKNEEFIKMSYEIALHTAALKPIYANRKDVPNEVIEKMKKELSEDIDNTKPKEIQEKILDGKIESELQEIVLEHQKFVKDESQTIKNMLEGGVQKFGERIEIGRIAVWNI